MLFSKEKKKSESYNFPPFLYLMYFISYIKNIRKKYFLKKYDRYDFFLSLIVMWG